MKHKFIITKDYLLLVNLNTNIKDNDTYLSLEGKILPFSGKNVLGDNFKADIVVAHVPLNNAPELEGVPLMPEFEENVVHLAIEYFKEKDVPIVDDGSLQIVHWGLGYKANTAKWSDEDIEAAIRYGFDIGFCANSSNKTKNNLQSKEEFLQSLSIPKLPIDFVLSTEYSTFEENIKHGQYIYK